MFEKRTFLNSNLCRTFAISSFLVTPKVLEIEIANCGLHLLSSLSFTVFSFSLTETVLLRRCAKKVFLKISPSSHENTCVGISFLIKLQVLKPANLLKRDSKTGAI